ncbi:hypothetical protein D9V41_13705 [Aeromicrobium phragmitis]|uniref:Uncharacterized protein n=1 Tax=Aeromicrobium phragmitis TaxID=2478914 RepID=A0A3L8PJK2_9ACTN|nr:hypothetical protein D9V41_13705 [Aeromicrobium phragmitis]
MARSFGITLVLTAAATAYCALWPGSGVVVEIWFGHPPRGANSYELAAVLLSIALPLVSLNSLGLAEHDAIGEARVPLLAHSVVLLVLPLVPFVAFYARVRLDGSATDLPHPAGMLATLLVYSAVAAILIRLLGPLFGGAAVLVLYVGVVLAQHYFGSSWLGGVVSTSLDWQTNPALLLVVMVGALTVNARTRGTLGRRLLIHAGNR